MGERPLSHLCAAGAARAEYRVDMTPRYALGRLAGEHSHASSRDRSGVTLFFAVLLSLLAVATLGLFAVPAAAQEPADVEPERLFGRGLAGEITLSAGIQFSSGAYTDILTTDLLYFPLSIAYAFDNFGLTPTPYDLVEIKLNVPLLYVRGPASFLREDESGNPGGLDPGGIAPRLVARTSDSLHGGGHRPCQPLDTRLKCGMAGGAGGSAVNSARGGIGDISVSASYIYLPQRGSALPIVELTGKAKIPTASVEKGLGTGAAAYSLQLEVSKTFGKKFTPIVMGGYRFADDADDYVLDNSGFASLGLDVRLSKRWSAGMFYDYYQASSSASADAHELSPYVLVRLTRRLRLAPNAVIGLSKGSPDYAIGLQIRYTLPVLR